MWDRKNKTVRKVLPGYQEKNGPKSQGTKTYQRDGVRESANKSHCKGFPEMFHRFFSQIFFGWCCYKCGSRFVFTSLMSYLLDDKWAPRFECRLPTPFHKQEMLRWPAERPLPGHPVGIHIFKCTWGRVGVRIQILRLQPQIKIDDPLPPLSQCLPPERPLPCGNGLLVR